MRSLRRRAIALATLWSVELIAITIRLDTRALQQQHGLTSVIGDWGPDVLRALITSTALYLIFAWFTCRGALLPISCEVSHKPVCWNYLAAHGCAMLAFCALSFRLFYRTRFLWHADLTTLLWLCSGVAGILLSIFVFFPPKVFLAVLFRTRRVWWISALGGFLACFVGNLGQMLWRPAITSTLSVVGILLRPFLSDLIVDPATRAIGSHSFAVIIGPGCSGLEGSGLMLVFSSLWLWFLRAQYRFPQALLCVPVAVLLTLFLNAVRIAALILIGNAGAPTVATGGFHSQAGWIFFNVAALGLVFGLRRIPWMSRGAEQLPRQDGCAENPTAWYLVPFLAIIAAAMISRATTNGFEWLYPLRVVAAFAALVVFRRRYVELQWQFGAGAVVVGGIAFLIWIALDLVIAPTSESTIGALALWSEMERVSWIIFRVLGAIVIIPIAEELAFRGFLLRRIISKDFDRVDRGRFTLTSVLVSSVLFGVMHGDRWLAGTITGVLYAVAFIRHGRIGDAVIGHAVTNGLIVAWVFWTGTWRLL